MNERIEKLAEQCWTHTSEPLFSVRSPHWEFDRYKFAELIVRDCVRVCNKQTPNWKGEYATAFGGGVEFCISGIKEHFGVDK